MVNLYWVYSDQNWVIQKGTVSYWLTDHMYEAVRDANGSFLISSEYENVIFNDMPTDMFEFIPREEVKMQPVLQITCLECGKNADIKPGEHWICGDCKNKQEKSS